MIAMQSTVHAPPNAAARIDRDLHIAGRDLPAADRATVEVTDPSDGSTIGTVADGSVADGLAAVDAAYAAAASWAATSPRSRSDVLMRCYALMLEHADELAWLISRENGKALTDALGEVTYAAEFFRWYAEEAVRITGEVSLSPSGTNRIMVQHQPVGVCLLVTPWNFPAAMATRKIAPALAAGCTMVLKPATLTPLTAFAVMDLLARAGVPDGVVNVVTTTRSAEVVSAILHDPRVRKLSFTGSTEVGRVLLHEAADQVLNCSMELGGNAPFIVLDDADLESAIDGLIVAKMRNGGQACTAANRVLISRSIQPAFAAALTTRMAALTVGRGTDAATACGPLIDAASLSKVSRLVEDAVNSGAELLTGGVAPDRPGFFYLPTVLADVSPDADIAREEIFGPIATLIPFDTDEEIIASANDTTLGLAAYVYSANLSRALAVADRLESGMVAVNRGLLSDPAAPFGGVKQSGLGREGSHAGLLEFAETKYIAVDW
jgi:succinate-semialdehyde dehydrogenase/glutarate-semialdehyde dehydrogenase